MSTSGHLIVKLRHPGANPNPMPMRLAHGVAQCVERLEARRTGGDPTGVEDQAGGNLIVFILFCGEIDRAHAVPCRQAYEGRDIARTADIVDSSNDDLGLERQMRGRWYSQQCRAGPGKVRPTAPCCRASAG